MFAIISWTRRHIFLAEFLHFRSILTAVSNHWMRRLYILCYTILPRSRRAGLTVHVTNANFGTCQVIIASGCSFAWSTYFATWLWHNANWRNLHSNSVQDEIQSFLNCSLTQWQVRFVPQLFYYYFLSFGGRGKLSVRVLFASKKELSRGYPKLI